MISGWPSNLQPTSYPQRHCCGPQIAPSPGDVIDDIGCGRGAQLRLLVRECSSVTLIDYGLRRTAQMRKRFRLVQKGDGFDNTEDNAQGVLPELMAEVGFDSVAETHVFETVSGSISIYRARVRGPVRCG
jgi:hypothetical protein